MTENILISGFADEIDPDFTKQLQTVTDLGMHYISLRSADGKGIADYTPQEVRLQLLPKLEQFGVKVSSLGSPIGKIPVDDESAFCLQLEQMERLCEIAHLLDCRYIRIFSFFIPHGSAPDLWKDQVLCKLKQLLAVACRWDVVLIHENEKDIFGDTAFRCRQLMDALGGANFASAFDFANFVQCGENPLECWQLLQPFIRYIHIKDAVSQNQENVLCGSGEGHIPELLTQAIQKEGYQGFLTLEPHLFLFDSLQSLETRDAHDIIRENKASNGAEAYAMQYHALMNILNKI